jgi:hypothetical protein
MANKDEGLAFYSNDNTKKNYERHIINMLKLLYNTEYVDDIFKCINILDYKIVDIMCNSKYINNKNFIEEFGDIINIPRLSNDDEYWYNIKLKKPIYIKIKNEYEKNKTRIDEKIDELCLSLKNNILNYNEELEKSIDNLMNIIKYNK